MINPVRVRLVKEWIIAHPYHSFAQAYNYAQELGASEDEIRQALQDIESDKSLNFPHTTTQENIQVDNSVSKKKFNLPVKKKSAAIISLLFLVGAGSIYTLINLPNTETQTRASDNIVERSSNNTPFDVLAPDMVYANQTPLSSDKVFSFPPTDITLKYSGTPTKEVVGFFPYWMLEREDQINIQGLTTVNLFGLETDGKGNIMIARDDGQDLGWKMWNDKKINSFLDRVKKRKMKVLITIKSFNNDNIESITASDESQERFISNAIQLVQSKSLDGINIDFEYIGRAPEQTRQGFVRLIANLNEELKRQVPDAVLTVDTYVTSGARNDFFEISLLEDHLDAFVIMGYDIHTPKGAAGPVAPLEGPSGIAGFVQSYLERVSADKLILAVPYYGYAWPDNGEPGKAISYAELANMSRKVQLQWNNTSQTPYFTYVEPESNLTYTAHFDNARSLGLKYDFILNKDLQGVAIWALGYDGLNQELQQVLLEKFTQ